MRIILNFCQFTSISRIPDSDPYWSTKSPTVRSNCYHQQTTRASPDFQCHFGPRQIVRIFLIIFPLINILKKSLQLLLLINSLFCDVFMLFQQKIPFSRWIKFQIGWICLRFTILRRLISTFSTETMLPNAKFLLINSIKVSVWCQIVPRSLRKYHNLQN